MQVAAIRADVTALVPFDQRTSCTPSSLACTDFLAGLVQLAFHDAGTFDRATGTGGPDGCVDLTLPENRGLRWIIGVIAPVFRKYASVISYADFVVLAANTAVYVASGNNVTLPFNWGRANGNDCQAVDRNRLPQESKSISHIKDVFVTRMGLTLQDIAALMGAHTIGRAEDTNSGYSGAWDSTSAVWDNQYYIEMVQAPWDREVRWVNNVQRFDWREPDTKTLMLNTDMALAFDIGDLDVNTGANTCNVGGARDLPDAPFTPSRLHTHTAVASSPLRMRSRIRRTLAMRRDATVYHGKHAGCAASVGTRAWQVPSPNRRATPPHSPPGLPSHRRLRRALRSQSGRACLSTGISPTRPSGSPTSPSHGRS
jgi:hypothetical protein